MTSECQWVSCCRLGVESERPGTLRTSWFRPVISNVLDSLSFPSWRRTRFHTSLLGCDFSFIKPRWPESSLFLVVVFPFVEEVHGLWKESRFWKRTHRILLLLVYEVENIEPRHAGKDLDLFLEGLVVVTDNTDHPDNTDYPDHCRLPCRTSSPCGCPSLDRNPRR